MNFVSWSFVVLFLSVFVGRCALGQRKTERPFVWLTIVASTVFVMWHVPIYLLIMLTSISVDYTAALIIDRASPQSRWRDVVLGLSMATNLLILGFFKYADFFLQLSQRSLERLGLSVRLPHLGLILPIGISFYTFGSMSYTIDVYRGRLRAVRRFQDFYYFVTFFPHMVAGPIVRAEQFFYQFARPRRLRLKVFNHGAFLIIRGLFLKMVCADNIGRVVNIYWASGYTRGCLGTPLEHHGYSSDLFVLMVLFSAQIFCDFEGYTNIARGFAYLLGFRFPINFRNPYIATSFSNFWERWHITLSSWLRDYLYIPLGGNRISPQRTYANLAVVMLLGGLWHGASLTFICWGAIHGTALAVERALGLNRDAARRDFRIAWYVVVQSVVLIAWVFFRSDSIHHALTLLHNVADLRLGSIDRDIMMACVFLIPAILIHLNGLMIEKSLVRPMSNLRLAVLAGAMLFAIVTAHGDSSEFIYFQF